MKNVSKNAVQAISLDGKMYLAHKSIENFSLGAGDFTIEVFFICNSITDCCFYTQEQGFEFGIKDGCLYFDLEGVGSIKQNEEISLETDALYFAAVSCKDGALSLYFEGFPVADKIEAGQTGTTNTGNYQIGRGLDGYIVELRLRSCGMTDQEILSDNGMGLRDCGSVEFWSDFTTVQYKDKSSHALPLWTNEGMVWCVNVCSCTQLSSKGGFTTAVKQSYTSSYTLLFKVFPQLENNNTMYIYSVVSSEGKTVFSVGLQSDNEGYKHVFVEHGGTSYLGNTALPLDQWIDVALRIESADAKVYVDGAEEMSFAFTGELTNITSVIGIKPFTKRVNFKNSFDGYLDYFAEFECALDVDKIDFYAEEQPYIFDESIRTLYAFYCGEPTDLASGDIIFKIGQSKAVFEKNLNLLEAPIGMELRVPQEVCSEWSELSEFEQWEMTAAMDMVRELYRQSFGFDKEEGTVPIEQAATKRIMQLYEDEIQLMDTVWTEENKETKMREFVDNSLLKAPGGLGLAAAGGIGLLAGGLSAVSAVSKTVVSIEVIMTVAEAIVAGGGVAALITILAIIIVSAIEFMPENKRAGIRLISVCCNHNGNPAIGSVHFHSDAELTLPESMTYINNGELEIDMLLIPDRLQNHMITANCEIENLSPEVVIGIFSIVDENGIILADFNLTIQPGERITAPLEIEVEGLGENNAAYRRDTWQFVFNERQLCRGHVNMYLQNSMPREPWQTPIEPYNIMNKNYPSLVFMKKMIFSLGDRGERRVSITGINDYMNKLFESGILSYNIARDRYVGEGGFRLIMFNGDLVRDGAVSANCTILANILCLTEAQLGREMRMTLIEPTFGGDGFAVNPLVVLGYNNAWSDLGEFSYHQVAFTSDNVDWNFSRKSKIYDLTGKIDMGPNPSNREGDKDAFLSGGCAACETEEPQVVIDEPYFERYYLERLVKNGEYASFSHLSMRARLDVNVVEADNQPNERYAHFLDRYIQNYGLDSERYTDEISQPEVQSSVLQEMGLIENPENRYESEWSAPDGMRVTWFRNAEHLPAGEYLASVLMRFPCRLTEKEAPELGERVFYGPDLLIAYSGGSAYLIECKEMGKAEEMAHNLKSSMIQ